MIRKAILSALLDKLSEKKLFLIKEMKFEKTKEAYSYLEKVRNNLKANARICILLGGNDQSRRCLSNLAQVELINANSLNPYSLLKNDFVFLSPEGLRETESYFNKETKNADRT